MMLCKNRPEGFGPESHLYSHVLTSCFIDTVLIPLCTWLYLLAIVILFLFSFRNRRSTSSDREYVPGIGFRRAKPSKADGAAYDETADNAQPHFQGTQTKKRGGTTLRLVLKIFYYLFLFAQFCMCILEITRLSLADLGIGLLPFTLVTLVLAGVLRATSGLMGFVRGWMWANCAAWVALAVCNGVKLAEEVKEGFNTRKGTKYPESDEVTDVAVIVGVYFVLVILEIALGR